MFSLSRFRTAAVAASAIALTCLVAYAKKEFSMPSAQPAAAYPAHEEHKDEAVTVAVDPYDMADKAGIFTIPYGEAGLLPLFVVITNAGDQPVTLTTMKAQFVTVRRTKISPSSPDDVYRRIAHPSASVSPYPSPFPRKKIKGGVSREANDEIQNAQFSAKAVEPHSTQAGFLFFDVEGISTPLAGAHFFLTGIRNAKGDELFYFDIPLEKYLTAPQATKSQ
jgi:hypothetical protein